jgi:intracellular sulfur oxidation DsrE/DsrF family protein
MKSLKIIMIILSIGLTFSSYGQQQIVKDDNIVFLLRQPEHFAQAVKTVASLKQKNVSRIKPSKVVIILCGEMVKQLASEEMNRQLEMACTQGITVYACGLSLDKFGIDKSHLPSSVLYVENGLIKSLELQKEGYLSIEL